MDLFTFVLLAGVYIMTMQFAVMRKDMFSLFLIIGMFVFGGAVGYLMSSYEGGLVLGIVLSLVFW